jgi:hypothetical protein
VFAPSPLLGWARALVVSSSPLGVEDKQAGLGCLVMSSPGPVAGSEHGAIRRRQQCSITYDDPLGVMPILRAGLLAASEPGHPWSGWARQRISPSRSP